MARKLEEEAYLTSRGASRARPPAAPVRSALHRARSTSPDIIFDPAEQLAELHRRYQRVRAERNTYQARATRSRFWAIVFFVASAVLANFTMPGYFSSSSSSSSFSDKNNNHKRAAHTHTHTHTLPPLLPTKTITATIGAKVPTTVSTTKPLIPTAYPLYDPLPAPFTNLTLAHLGFLLVNPYDMLNYHQREAALLAAKTVADDPSVAGTRVDLQRYLDEFLLPPFEVPGPLCAPQTEGGGWVVNETVCRFARKRFRDAVYLVTETPWEIPKWVKEAHWEQRAGERTEQWRKEEEFVESVEGVLRKGAARRAFWKRFGAVGELVAFLTMGPEPDWEEEWGGEWWAEESQEKGGPRGSWLRRGNQVRIADTEEEQERGGSWLWARKYWETKPDK